MHPAVGSAIGCLSCLSCARARRPCIAPTIRFTRPFSRRRLRIPGSCIIHGQTQLSPCCKQFHQHPCSTSSHQPMKAMPTRIIATAQRCLPQHITWKQQPQPIMRQMRGAQPVCYSVVTHAASKQCVKKGAIGNGTKPAVPAAAVSQHSLSAVRAQQLAAHTPPQNRGNPRQGKPSPVQEPAISKIPAVTHFQPLATTQPMYAPATPSQALLQPESSAIVFNNCRPRRIGKEASERTWKLDKTVPCEDGVERVDADEFINS